MAENAPLGRLVRGAERRATAVRLSFAAGRGGNVAVMFSLALLPMLLVIGMALDYTIAGRRQAQLAAIADAAALTTTTPDAMQLSARAARAQAVAMFNAQAASIRGATVDAPNIQVQDTADSSGVTTRVTTVPYAGSSANSFAKLVNMPTMPIGGTSKVSKSSAPNVDFWLLLDTSPSMVIPSSQDGINKMMAATPKQGDPGPGCAFACHQTDLTTSDTAGNPPGMDNYALARQLGITLRMDLVVQATANLMQNANSTEQNNGAVYRASTWTFDMATNNVTPLTADLRKAQTDASAIQAVTVVRNLYTTKGFNDDEGTQFDPAMQTISSKMPSAGKGTNAPGDAPQEVLFIVTDGMIDEAYPGTGPKDNVIDWANRTITTVGHQADYCTPLKSKGIKIAVLYTTYNTLPLDNFYKGYVSSIQPRVATGLQSCASPGLFFQVDTGGDINAAMQALFNRAVLSAHLTQ